jgi:enamine deaminase RidA (YjgF/YER057c/UK114 family)
MKLRILLVSVLFPIVALAQQADRRFISSDLAKARNLPFSSGVVVGNTLYIAGTTADTDKIKGGLTAEAEARDVMEQIKGTVQNAGMSMDDIVSMQVFCTDLDLYDAFNSVYRTYFKGNFPARAFIGGSKLLFGARFEVLGVAVKRGSGR